MTRFLFPTAIYIAIRDDILFGYETDKNLQELARQMKKNNVQIKEARIIREDPEMIPQAISESVSKCDFVFISSGNDGEGYSLVKKSLAKTFSVNITLNKDLFKRFKQRPVSICKNSQGSASCAYIPDGSIAIESEDGRVVGIVINNVYLISGDHNDFRIATRKIGQLIAKERPTVSHSMIFPVENNKIEAIVECTMRKYPDVKVDLHPFVTRHAFGSKIIVYSSALKHLSSATDFLQNKISALIFNDGNTKRII